MPTGYTAKLVESGQTFEEFVLTCARAFGALIELRDEPLDAPIPETLEPHSYYAEAVVEAKKRLTNLLDMPEEEREKLGLSFKEKKSCVAGKVCNET
jgi:hypothetical protein